MGLCIPLTPQQWVYLYLKLPNNGFIYTLNSPTMGLFIPLTPQQWVYLYF